MIINIGLMLTIEIAVLVTFIALIFASREDHKFIIGLGVIIATAIFLKLLFNIYGGGLYWKSIFSVFIVYLLVAVLYYSYKAKYIISGAFIAIVTGIILAGFMYINKYTDNTDLTKYTSGLMLISLYVFALCSHMSHDGKGSAEATIALFVALLLTLGLLYKVVDEVFVGTINSLYPEDLFLFMSLLILDIIFISIHVYRVSVKEE